MLIDDVDWELSESPEFDQVEQQQTDVACQFEVCPTCGGPGGKVDRAHRGYQPEAYRSYAAALSCPECTGVGFIGVPIGEPSFIAHRPGSVERVAIMAARYRAGLTVMPGRDREALQFS